ncbi:RNA 2',3'-cyclic phosphodiesterase [Acerihabitans arboris]|uniref:RNA 2',3'-cyclic phosphodiesterase n=1 Tax=Acerihabitans arboris TaxID=2691583 RepID=A0A845SCW1_9GAMM|nr:RNA 2',3'-cyclic phosphodiesterase [Acerihabitans arboris]NDL61242.1 RNA 2',3'-cyclic phosphodiesterase [Acerihabitans arboris]
MTSTRRLFFAIALPDSVRQAIIGWRAGQFPYEAGRPVAAANLHITLAFLGEVSANKEQALRAAAMRLQQKPFTLALDDCGHWPGSGVVWLGMKRAPRGLLQLAQRLRAQAARNGCYQSPLPFHPHVTLLRQARQAVALPPGAPGWEITVDGFSLYASLFDNGRTRYMLLDSWPLAGRRDSV